MSSPDSRQTQLQNQHFYPIQNSLKVADPLSQWQTSQEVQQKQIEVEQKEEGKLESTRAPQFIAVPDWSHLRQLAAGAVWVGHLQHGAIESRKGG